jgi:hypothetical protein
MGKKLSLLTSKLIKAFEQDGFTVDQNSDVIEHDGNIGVRATHKTAVIGRTRRKKKAFYIEGDAHTQGYLIGKLAEPEIERMCTEFNYNIVFDFINIKIKDPVVRKIIGDILEDIVYLMSKRIFQDVPPQYNEEIEGMLDGCQEVHKKTKVDRESLWVLNVGFDALLSYIYTGIFPHKKIYPIKIESKHLRVPIMCNGFSAFGRDPQANANYHYLGRDFMFPTADVFQDTAAIIIRKPDNGLPTVSVAAPGMAGAIAGLNKNGVGAGLDMLPALNCDPVRPGFNSLLLTRHSIQLGGDCNQASETIVDAQRGVSWAYVLADGTNDKSCIIEAGATGDDLNFLSYADDWVVKVLKKVDPRIEDLLKTPSTPLKRGAMVRWNDYQYPGTYQIFNQALVDGYKEKHPKYAYKYNPDDFSEKGYLDKLWTEKNCPGPFYFPPQREDLANMVLVTNHQIIPEMRLCAMNDWIATIAAGNLNDIQWRYDELNKQMLTSLGKGYITYEEAKDAIDFLAPDKNYADYYNKDRKPLNQVQIRGSVSLMDLKKKTIETHYGYYSDEWIKICLNNYL